MGEEVARGGGGGLKSKARRRERDSLAEAERAAPGVQTLGPAPGSPLRAGRSPEALPPRDLKNALRAFPGDARFGVCRELGAQTSAPAPRTAPPAASEGSARRSGCRGGPPRAGTRARPADRAQKPLLPTSPCRAHPDTPRRAALATAQRLLAGSRTRQGSAARR